MCLEEIDWTGFDEVAEACENGVPVNVRKDSLLRTVRNAIVRRVMGEEDEDNKGRWI